MATKQKLDTVRIYDKDGFRLRAACVCVKDRSYNEVLLISSNHNPDLWIIPGGGKEPGEVDEEAAEREVLEEAGVKGTIISCLGTFELAECKHRTMVFLMLVKELLPEWQESLSIGRKRRWFTLNEARNHLKQHRNSQFVYLKDIYTF